MTDSGRRAGRTETGLIARAPGKVNLCLYLGGRRSDGRHELVTVIQSVSLADEVILRPAPDGADADEVICPEVAGPNLAGQALAAFRARTGWDAPPQRLEVRKCVPVAGGMGGGSADAAAALRLAATAAGVIDYPLLLELAARLGADVPSQVAPGRALAEGAGELVQALEEVPGLGVLILPSKRRLSTAEVFAEADRQGLPREAQDLLARRRVVRGALGAGRRLPAELMHNDLQPAALALEPEIATALADALEAGADRALVSGSGPTVAGVFLGADGERRARRAAASLADRDPPALAAVPVGPAFGEPRPL